MARRHAALLHQADNSNGGAARLNSCCCAHQVIHEVIGPQVRLESCGAVWREQGQAHGGLHGGGPQQADPIFGYRCLNGKIHAGMVRVIFEFTEIREGDGGV